MFCNDGLVDLVAEESGSASLTSLCASSVGLAITGSV